MKTTFEKDEVVVVSDDGEYWYVRYYSHDSECFEGGFTSKKTPETRPWKHIEKLTDFNK